MPAELPQENRPWYQGPAFWMLVALIAFYVASSFTPPASGTGSAILNLLTVSIVLFGLRAFSKDKTVFRAGLILVVSFSVLSAVGQATLRDFDFRWNSIAVLVFFLLMMVALARVIFKTEQITVDKIFAAANFYMLMGIVFGLLFLLIEQTTPGSFTLTEVDKQHLPGSLVHFSFTTLTTVGYGNISPISNPARSLADMEAVLAQLFLAVVLARLVSLEITYRDKPGGSENTKENS